VLPEAEETTVVGEATQPPVRWSGPWHTSPSELTVAIRTPPVQQHHQPQPPPPRWLEIDGGRFHGLMMQIREDFTYVHEPLAADKHPGMLNSGPLRANELAGRITHSRGGTFLITGFRGVGKTTHVLRALGQAIQEASPSVVIVPVVLSVARSITTDQLLFAVVRRLFEALDQNGTLNRMHPEARRALLVAYMRTSMSFKQTQTRSSETSASMDLAGVGGAALAGLAGVQIPKLGVSAKRARSAATEAAFLAYSQTDVEHDLIRIVQLVNDPGERARPRWRRRRRGFPRVHLVVVLDEMDKLTAGGQGLTELEQLVSEAKNVLAMPGVHFLLVAGVELHDVVVKDAARGNGVYESVIAWRQYVPCVWNGAEELVRNVLAGSDAAVLDQPAVRQLIRYLEFKARGVLRRLLQELNSLVTWWDGAPVLILTPDDQRRIAFYAGIQSDLDKYFQRPDKRLFALAVDEDRWRLGAYFLVDWVLRSEGLPITAADAVRAVEIQEIDSALRITERNASRLLDHLFQSGVLALVRPGGLSVTQIGDVAGANQPIYRLADAVRDQLLGFARENEQDRAAHFDTSMLARLADPRTEMPAASAADREGLRPGPEPTDTDQEAENFVVPAMGEWPSALPSRLRNALGDGRYRIIRLLGSGGVGAVYAGRDMLLDRDVAIKVVVSSHADDNVARARFAREARITAGLNSPRIVQVYDIVQASNDAWAPWAIVMELIEGPTLNEALTKQGPLAPAAAVSIGMAVAEALAYLSDEGINRTDVKPSNIMLHPNRGPVLIDLGIAKRTEPEPPDDITSAGAFIGTPAYMAPEQFTASDTDIRTDIYSLGCTLYTCLTGEPPFGHSFHPDRLRKGPDTSALPGSPELRAVIDKAAAPRPDDRYATPHEMLAALEATPEAQTDDGQADSPV
jgi:serine/threonine-protein kinase